jgi:hypothetical protein
MITANPPSELSGEVLPMDLDHRLMLQQDPKPTSSAAFWVLSSLLGGTSLAQKTLHIGHHRRLGYHYDRL